MPKNINQPEGWFFIGHSHPLIACKFIMLKNLIF